MAEHTPPEENNRRRSELLSTSEAHVILNICNNDDYYPNELKAIEEETICKDSACVITAMAKQPNADTANRDDDENEEFPAADDDDDESSAHKSTNEPSAAALSVAEAARLRHDTYPLPSSNPIPLSATKGTVSEGGVGATTSRVPGNGTRAQGRVSATDTTTASPQSPVSLVQLQAFIEMEITKTIPQAFSIVMFGLWSKGGVPRMSISDDRRTSAVGLETTHFRPTLAANAAEHGERAWVEIGRTEVIRTGENDGAVGSRRFQSSLSLLLPHPTTLRTPYVMIQLYRLESSHRTEERTRSELVAHCVFPSSVLRSSRVTYTSMEVVSKPVVDISDPEMVEKELTSVKVGLVALRSERLQQLRLRTRNQLCMRAYAENLYAFPSMDGQVFCMEQLFVSKYAIHVPRALIHLVMQERMPVVSDLLEQVENELGTACAAIEGFGDPSQPIDAKAISNTTDFSSLSILWGDDNTFETDSVLFRAVTKIDALRKAKSDLQLVQLRLEEKYQSCLEHCDRCVRNRLPKNKSKKRDSRLNMIPLENGGSFLRRSVWKKSPVWQFCPTNLNVQLFYAHPVQYSELTANEADVIYRSKVPDVDLNNQATATSPAGHTTTGSGEVDQQSESSELAEADDSAEYNNVSLFPSLTFGCIAAHPLGFAEGGLRRLLPNPRNKEGFTQQELLKLIQTTGGLTPSVIQKLKDEPQVGDALLQAPIDIDPTVAIIRSKVRLFLLAERIDTVGSQALSVAAAAFHTLLITAACGSRKHQEILSLSMEAGFLVSVESLLSTRGHELGMLEDMAAALDWLSTCHIRLVRKKSLDPRSSSTGKAPQAIRHVGHGGSVWLRREDGGGLILDLELTDFEINAVLQAQSLSSIRDYKANQRPVNPLPSIEEDLYTAYTEVIATVPLTGVMFSQGINEMQTLSNMSMSGESASQREMNMENYARLREYTETYRAVLRARAETSSMTFHQIKTRLNKIDRMLLDVQDTIRRESSASGKNVNVLLKTSFLCRELAGVHAICCKSGKDRTSMAVTLEQSKHLVEAHQVTDGKNACRLFRAHGVRRVNVFANTGQKCYAFNQIQIQCIPKAYRPPYGTFSGRIQA